VVFTSASLFALQLTEKEKVGTGVGVGAGSGSGTLYLLLSQANIAQTSIGKKYLGERDFIILTPM
jgi:hypothetical protein